MPVHGFTLFYVLPSRPFTYCNSTFCLKVSSSLLELRYD